MGGNVRGGVRINSPTIIRRGDRPAGALKAYLAAIIRECAPLRLKGVDQRAARPNAEPLTLASVYVDLKIDLRLAEDKSLAAHLKSPARAGREGMEQLAQRHETRLVPALEALVSHPCLVLLGAPGSGKSTLSQYLALRLAEVRQGNRKALACLGGSWTLGRHWSFGTLLPVRVSLRQFAAHVSGKKGHCRASDLWNFVGEELEACTLGKATGVWLKREVLKSGALFLLDGLDETKDSTLRARVAEAVAELARNAGTRSRFLLTSRPYAWEEMQQCQTDPSLPAALREEKAAFAELLTVFPANYRLAEFEPEQTKLFIRRWYEALEARDWITQADAAAQAPVLQQAAQRPDLQHLGRNPLLLTLMATLHSNRTRLPDDRADLYNEVVELLLQRWNENIGADRGLLEALQIPTLKLSDLRLRIEELALDIHGAHVGEDGLADIAEGRLLAAFRDLLGGSMDKAALVVEYVEKRAGLLLGQGSRGRERQFTFPHRTFQEFLAGCHLAGRRDFETKVVRLAEDNHSHWREVLKFAARRATASPGVPAADVLVGHQDVRWEDPPPSELDCRKAILAAEQLLEIGLAAVSGVREHDVIRRRVAGWLVSVLSQSALPARERVKAGDLLASLGDPRVGVVPTRLEELGAMEFCHVPPGQFVTGEGKGARRDASLTDGYWIGRYPVTVAQFTWFVNEGGYRHAEFWMEAARAGWWKDGRFRPRDEGEWTTGPWAAGAPFDLANHPVVGVSWYEALAFCRWLTAAWTGRLPPSYVLFLPSEAEWEKAARGAVQLPGRNECRTLAVGLVLPRMGGWKPNPKSQRAYPWGDELDPNRVNCTETEIGATSAVGCFSDGASPYEVCELSGNVWEWCRRLPDGIERSYTDQDATRVLRGGAWLDSAHIVQCVCGRRLEPGLRYTDVGFRVMASPLVSGR